MSKEKALFKFPAGANLRLRHSACGDPTTLWKEVPTGALKPDGKPETKTRYVGDVVAKTMGGFIDDLILIGGLKFDPTTPVVCAPALKAEWTKLLAHMKAAKIQVSVGIAPQPLTSDVDAFNDFVFGKDSLVRDPGFERCAQALVDLMDRDLPGWAGLSFDIEHIHIKDPQTGYPPLPARREAAVVECTDRLTLFYQAVCIAASPRMVKIVAGAKIDAKHCFVHSAGHKVPAPTFAVVHDWTKITALPNSTLLAMAYDGEPGGGAEGRMRWHRDTIKYAVSLDTDPADRPYIHPSKFQLLIKTGKSNKQGEPGMLRTSGEIEGRMGLAREFSIGICYFPGAPANLSTCDELLNRNGGAPKPGATHGHPYQHPIDDVVKTFS